MTTLIFATITGLFILASAVAVGKSLRCSVLEAELDEANARVWALRRALNAADSNRQIILNGRVWRRYLMQRSPTQLPIHRN